MSENQNCSRVVIRDGYIPKNRGGQKDEMDKILFGIDNICVSQKIVPQDLASDSKIDQRKKEIGTEQNQSYSSFQDCQRRSSLSITQTTEQRKVVTPRAYLRTENDFQIVSDCQLSQTQTRFRERANYPNDQDEIGHLEDDNDLPELSSEHIQSCFQDEQPTQTVSQSQDDAKPIFKSSFVMETRNDAERDELPPNDSDEQPDKQDQRIDEMSQEPILSESEATIPQILERNRQRLRDAQMERNATIQAPFDSIFFHIFILLALFISFTAFLIQMDHDVSINNSMISEMQSRQKDSEMNIQNLQVQLVNQSSSNQNIRQQLSHVNMTISNNRAKSIKKLQVEIQSLRNKLKLKSSSSDQQFIFNSLGLMQFDDSDDVCE